MERVESWLSNQKMGGFDNKEFFYNNKQFLSMKAKYEGMSFADIYVLVSECIERINMPYGIGCSCGGRDDVCSIFLPGKKFNNLLNKPIFVPEDTTLFDLASVSKLFLAIVYLYFYENSVLSLEKEVGFYSNRFPKIKDIRIRDMLSFNVILRTSKRIDECKEFEEAYYVLREIEGIYSKYQNYSDMPALVLADLLQDIVGMSFSECLTKLLSQGAEGTYDIRWGRSLVDCPSCMDYSNEIWKKNTDYYLRSNPLGVVNDGKARILSNDGERLCGHAGIFASIKGINSFCKSLLREEFISINTLKMLAEGSGWEYKADRQSFGYQCYRKYPDSAQTEVPFFLSGYATAMAGFTGCYLMMDYINRIFVFIGGNRLKNSLSRVVGSVGENTDNTVMYNGEKYWNKLNYVYERDAIRDCLSQIALVKYSQ